MIGTSFQKSPMSGTLTPIVGSRMACSNLRVDWVCSGSRPYLAMAAAATSRFTAPFVGERFNGREHDPVPVDLEVAQLFARIGAAEPSVRAPV